MSKARNLGELLDANGDVLANHLDHQSTSASDLTSGTLPAARLEALTLVAATQAESDNSTKVATTAYVTGKITTLIGGAPSTLNDLNELAAAINDDASYHSTLTTALATKLPLAGGAMTGNIVMADDTSIGISDSAERIEFDGAGDINILGANLGIGTTAPTNLLHIDGAAGNTFKQFTNNTTGHASGDGVIIGLAQDDSMLRIENRENAHIRFNTNNAERMRILNDGNVGIGTASPSHTLDVIGDSKATRLIGRGIIENSSGVSGDTWAVMGLNTSNAAGSGGAVFGSKHADSNALLVGTHDATFNSFVVKGSGKVGIGTTSPDGKFHVYSGDAGSVGPSSQADDLVVENSAEGGITILTPDASSARIRFSSPSTNTEVGGANIFYRQNINKMNVGTQVSGGVLELQSGAGSATMTLKGDGKVGIGTSAPANRLHVDYSVSASSANLAESKSVATIAYHPLRNGSNYGMYFGNTAAAAGYVQITDGSSTGKMNINPYGGSVGINNASPNHSLDVNGDSVQNGVRTFTARFNVANNVAIGFDVAVANEGGGGQSFMIHCGHNHYYVGGYGTHRIGMVSTRGTSISDVLNVGHQTSGNGGSWSFSKPSSTILRITKNAGSYAGGGAGFVHVVFSSFM